MAILLTWAVLGIAFYWLGTAQTVVGEINRDQVPRLMQTSLLSIKTADLASLSNRILYTREAAPGDLEKTLRISIAELKILLEGSLNDQIAKEQSEQLQKQLSAVIHTLDSTRQMENQMLNMIDNLRWINVDIQAETAALVADFAYNIEVLTRKLQNATKTEQRAQIAEALLHEQKVYAAFVDLGTDVSVSTTLAIQSSTSIQPEQLKQFADLMSDSLNRINKRLIELPVKAEYVTLRQSAEMLNELTVGATGLVNNRMKWHQERGRLSEYLNSGFALLSDMQLQLRLQAEKHRDDFARTSASFADDALFTMQTLVFLTIFAALAGFAILFLYIRPSIILPMQNLTTAMKQIATGQNPKLEWLPHRNDEVSELASAVGAFRDSVYERDQAIEKLRQTQSELVQAGKMAALGTLSAGISHELNQPLGAIRQRLHLTSKALAVQDISKARRQTDKVENLVVRMEKIIDHLRRFARRSEYRRDEVALSPIANSAFELLATSISSHDISFQIDPELENASIIGDPVLLEQVLVNIISNAVDAIIGTGKGGEILIRHEEFTQNMLTFSIVDTGTGLGDLTPEYVVEPFVTTKPPGEGIGLGLSISFNILTGMGGNLVLARRKGVGTRVTIKLPGRRL